ncbi:beta-ketoacyl-[acyl-carrier-protein] synthase family protein [Streptosporangium sp. NPDC000396]|uniref:beta-ketoacyl-[acyl-carrier-protein] synthase family protein n=1 Tax=Streptosporangium sp. NPDC000396 TaxID=3366185 RepID=UPI0036A9B88E
MTAEDRRVVVTGLGAVSCLGGNATEYWNGLLAGGMEPREVPLPHLNMRATKMYLTAENDIPAGPSTFGAIRLGAGPRMAIAAAHEALADAGLNREQCRDLPVVMGVEMGNADMHEGRRGNEGAEPGEWTPLTITASAVGAAIGSRAANTSVGNACSAGGYALTIAMDMIRSGEAEQVLVGGGEGVTRVGMGGFDRLGAADPVRCRPFDRDRAGTMFGDGAAMVVVESAGHANRRGARAYAELAGAAWSCDAHHPTAPDPEGRQVVRAMTEALEEAGISPDGIGCVLPHGTGTPLNDVVESRALRQVFGDRTDRLPLLSLKGMIGHTAGAAGAFGCLTAALVLRHGKVPANRPINQDPECRVWLPQEQPVPMDGTAVLVNTYAFGGNNTSFVLSAGGVEF